MRILVVSAHYPPNFVSGGTLAPKRIAEGLRERGHDVSVYAGWLGHDRPPLEAFDDASGPVPVRWIVSQPFIDWSARTNFDNPSVTSDFAATLDRLRPDLVHFHSLQSLGAGLVDAAADRSVPTVVTMHDFWWFCGRQFLATREYRPCSLVVSCGVCACEVDHDWLVERDGWLAERLRRVDLVLAVSRSAADALVANGVDPERLVVDENGMPGEAVEAVRTAKRAPRDRGGEVRFVYAGGPDRMKGVDVLFEAAALLRPEGWHLSAFGAADFAREAGVDFGALPVEVLPPFEPDDIGSVLARADVLVVPSVARETHSLLTREALAAGVPVVVSDTPGPAEVVRHGDNGLVVPAGDAVALAGALQSLVDDADLLGRLTSGAAGPVELRTVDEQLASLERLFATLVAPPGPRAAASEAPAVERYWRSRQAVRSVQRVAFLVGIEGAPLRYRARLPAEGLALLGVTSDVFHYRDPAASDAALGADAVVVYRVPATTQVLELLGRVRDRGVPLFFDVDDLIFDPGIVGEIRGLDRLSPDERALYMQGVRRYRTTMEACDAFIGSTAALCEHVEDVVGLPSFRFFNGVGQLLAQASDVATLRPRSPGPLRIGYLSGTNTHDDDWLFVEPAVVSVLDARPEVELWIGGHVAPSPALDRFGGRVRRLPFQHWSDLPQTKRDLDVNLAPLAPGSRFNQAKSAIKWLEAALTETPTVASPTQPFAESIRDGETGLLAATVEEWEAALLALLDDDGLRRRIGGRARHDALLRWSPHVQGRRYLAILESEIPPRRPSTWDGEEALDEPPVPHPLEPYVLGSVPVAPAPVAPPPPSVASRLAALGRRGVHSLRHDGARATARRALRVAVRVGRRVVRRRPGG